MNRLAAIWNGQQNNLEKSYQGFLLIATFLQAQGGEPVRPGLKRELRQWLDEFYTLVGKADGINAG